MLNLITNKEKIWVLIMVSISILPVACTNKGSNIPSYSLEKQKQVTKRKMPEYVPPKPPAVYIYQGADYRDPFVPTGSTFISNSTGTFSDDFMDKEKMTTLKLRGIIRGTISGDAALITDTLGGAYILTKGKLYNRKSLVLKGVSGVIGSNSVTISGGGTTIELKLKKTMGE